MLQNIFTCIAMRRRSLGERLLRSATVLCLCSTFLAAAQANERMPRMETPEKLTVGPDNHFQVAITPSEEKLFFTRSTHLATRLFWRGLKGYQALGQVEPFVKAEFDTKDPSLSPDGSRIAYTSFESQARGDICVQGTAAPASAKPLCADEKAASEQPFWLGNGQVGYIRRPTGSNKAQLVIFDTASRAKKVLFEDQILSATADPASRWIVFSALQTSTAQEGSEIPVFKVWQLKDNQSWSLKLNLPGLPGFPHFDDKGDFLYFAQFSNDTNSDARIDGNDNGVIFRIGASELEEKTSSVLPEQLTTSEQNCNFPAPGRDFLYMTCAFEGSLDVYRIPKTGLIPSRWDEKTLLDAYRTSRSIAERTLIINSLRHRFSSYRKLDSLEKILSHHILTGEYQAALYYIDSVEAGASAAQRPGFAILRSLLEVLQYRARERLDQVSPEFIALLSDKRRFFERQKGAYRAFADLALAYVDLSLQKQSEAKKKFTQVSLSNLRSSLEHYVYLNLARTLESQKVITPGIWFDSLIRVSEAQVVSDESAAFLATQILQKTAELNKSASERLKFVTAMRKKVKAGGVLDRVLNSQEALLSVANAASDAEEDKNFAEFNKLIAKIGDAYFLRRVISIQGVLTLAEFNKTRVMGYIDSNWLSAAKIADTEYMRAREQYVSVVLDEGYGLWAKGRVKPASQVFYSAVRLTDDQESHLAFVMTLLQENNRKLLEERYASLKGAGFQAENLEFAQAVLALFDDLAREDMKSVALLEKAEKILLSLKDDGSRPAGKHLLLGYIAHQKMLRSMKGFTFDEDLSQAAHHQYMIALDLARRSPRLSGRILSNLALLHLETGHFGLAAGYFAAREKIAFEDDLSQLAFLTQFAQALYRNGEFGRAADVALQGLALGRKMKLDAPALTGLLERTAFYLSQSSRFEDAATYYQELLNSIGVKKDENAIKTRLMAGWSYLRSGQSKRASEMFDSVLSLADQLSYRKGGGVPGDVIDFRPDRYKVLALGFLTQMSTSSAARIPLRRERLKMMREWKGELKSYALSSENWARFLLKDCSSLSTDLWLASEAAASKESVETCLKMVSDVAEDSAEFGNESVLETLRVTWMLSSRLAARQVVLSEKAKEHYFTLARKALSKLDAIAGGSRPMAKRWLQLRAESLAASHLLLQPNQRGFVSLQELQSELDKLSRSDRLELLSAEERSAFSVELQKLRNFKI